MRLSKEKQLLLTKEWLMDQHHNLKKSVSEIAIEIGVAYSTIFVYLKKFELDIISYKDTTITKRKHTCLKKYGVESYTKTKDYQDKVKKSCLEKYGETSPNSVGFVKEKKKNAFIKKYGVEHLFQSDEFKAKQKTNNLLKYGVENIAHKHMSKDTIDLLKNKNWLTEQHHILNKTHLQIAKDLNVSPACVDRAMCRCGIETKNFFISDLEKELLEFISSVYNKEIITNSRNIISPLELDIYIPEKQLAIEFDGLYWHSYDREETAEEKNYHLNKTQRCKERGIQLIHIFENEWCAKKDLVKSLIKNKLGICDNQIGARECRVETADYSTKKFLELNHIQGTCQAKIKLALYYKDEIVSLMTFGRPRFNSKHEWELIRYCTKLNTVVIGGAKKLFKYFIKTYNPKSIISYCNLRYFSGKIYDTLGFKQITISKPNYFYTKDCIGLFSRMHFQKHKLPKLLSTFNSELTESQNMFNNGFRRVWDCGNLVYIHDGVL